MRCNLTLSLASVRPLVTAMPRVFPWTLLLLLAHGGFISTLRAEMVLQARDFGLTANGTVDDGPAIRRMLERARAAGGPVTVLFPKDRTIAVTTGVNRYVFQLDGYEDLTIDGNGCTFCLDPHLRFVNAFRCRNLSVVNLKIDFLEQPTTPGTIVAVRPNTHSVVVRLDHPELAGRLGGPTHQDGEQAFFGMILLDCLYDMTRVKHYYIDAAEVQGAGLVELFSPDSDFGLLQREIRIGSTRIGLPVPGIAHRHGPGALAVINFCDGVWISEMEVWSAPWFAFQVFRNRGPVTFQSVHVRPKPGSRKVLSSCRDAIHVKGNRGRLRFEGCILSGLGDDAFNISTHCSRIRQVISPTELEIKQHFPIQFIPILAGDTLVVMSGKTNQVIGESRIAAVEVHAREDMASEENQFRGRAPTLTVRLVEPITGLEESQVAWAREVSNPQTVIKDCTIRRSCRFQSSLLLENCDVEAYVTFYGDATEGPGPERVEIRHCALKSASWSESLGTAVSFDGFEGSEKRNLEWQMVPETVLLKQTRLIDNEVWGRLQFNLILDLELRNNRIFYERANPVRIENVRTVARSENSVQKPGAPDVERLHKAHRRE